MLWGDEAYPYALAQVPPTLQRQEKHGKVNYAGGRQSKLYKSGQDKCIGKSVRELWVVCVRD